MYIQFIKILLAACLLAMFAQVSIAEQYDVAFDCTIKWQENDDRDEDGLSDSFENCLANKHAPVLYLPLSMDWIRPTSVDWYLPRVRMRFNHDNNCSDDPVTDTPTQSELVSQSNRTKKGWANWPWEICDYTDTIIYSDILRDPHWSSDHHFFLQANNDNSHSGSTDSVNNWKVYVHSYPSNTGVNIEYWYFFPYNDNVSWSNHEGDWEHILIKLDCNNIITQIIYYQHGEPSSVNRSNIEWFENTTGGHPLVWIADGSHASYPHNDNACNSNWKEGSDTSCETVNRYRWFTWSGGKGSREGYQGFGLVQLGETDRHLNGQIWIRYAGRWGEIGEVNIPGPGAFTSGPTTPSMKKDTWGEGKRSSYICGKIAQPHLIIDPALMSTYTDMNIITVISTSPLQ